MYIIISERSQGTCSTAAAEQFSLAKIRNRECDAYHEYMVMMPSDPSLIMIVRLRQPLEMRQHLDSDQMRISIELTWCCGSSSRQALSTTGRVGEVMSV